MSRLYEFKAIIHLDSYNDDFYIEFPWNAKKNFAKIEYSSGQPLMGIPMKAIWSRRKRLAISLALGKISG